MQTNTTFKLFEKRDFGQVINATFSFIRLTAKSLFRNQLIFAAPLFVLPAIINAGNQFNSLSGESNVDFVSQFFSLFLYTCGCVFSAIICGRHIAVFNESGKINISTDEMLGYITNGFLKIFGITVVYYIAFVLGTILLLIPGIYLAVALSLTIMIAAINPGTGFMFPFEESLRLIKNNWWLAFGLFLVIFALTYILIIVFSIPLIVTTALVAINSIKGAETESYKLLFTVGTALTQFSYSFSFTIPFISTGIFYFSLREKKDNVSMLSQIEEFGKSEDLTVNNEGGY